jgi:peptide/nickel transport system permease protein
MTAVPLARKGLLRNPGLRAGVIGSLAFLLLGFLSIAWTPHSIDTANVAAALQDPGTVYWLGTDHVGRDVLSLLMKGTLASFVVAAVAVAIGAIVGIPLGLAAAAWGGSVDWLVLRTTSFIVTFPALILAILVAAVFGPGPVVVMIAVGVFNVTALAQAAREGLLHLKTRDYVAAARLAGMGPIDIARRHILPGIAGLILVQAMVQLALGVLAEASLSYVGLGAQAPAVSLGLMLRDAQTYALLKPALALVPGVTILLVVAALNLAADGFREQLGIKLRHPGEPSGTA